MLRLNPQHTIQIGHNFGERIDERTVKILCVTCGGKGFYLLCNYPETSGELTACDCEQGFKYEKILNRHGSC